MIALNKNKQADEPRSLLQELHRVRGNIRYHKSVIDKLELQLESLLDQRKSRPECVQLYSVRGRYRRGTRNKLNAGIKRITRKSGAGVECTLWRVTLTVDGKSRRKEFSEGRLGADAAKLLCSLYRMIWLIEEGIWNKTEGDPFALVSEGGFFSGREDMEDTGCDYETMRQMNGALE